MRQAERLIALRALLARVQANAHERRAELAALGLGPDAPRPEAVVSEPPIAPPPRTRTRERVPTPRGRFDDDDWSSLLTRDLNDPSPERRGPAPEPPPPPTMPFSRVASFAPPPLPADLMPEVAAVPPPAPSAHRIDEEDQQPDSEIVRAIRQAAEHPHPVVDPRDLWTGAGPELRERKPPTNPPVPPRPEDLVPDDDDEPILDLVRITAPLARISSRPPPPPEEPRFEHVLPSRTPDVTALAPPAPPVVLAIAPPHEEPPEPPEPPPALSPPPSYLVTRSRGRRLERAVSPRKRTASRVVAALVVAAPLAGLAAWSLLDDPRPLGRGAATTTTGSAPAAASTARSPSFSAPPRAPDPPQLASTRPEPPPPAPARAQTAIPPPPNPGNPRESGMLWVDADPASAVFVQGVAAGDSGKWLEVACGMKNVRLARPGLPPPGHSYPMWLGVGQTVLIPCGGSHRVALRSD